MSFHDDDDVGSAAAANFFLELGIDASIGLFNMVGVRVGPVGIASGVIGNCIGFGLAAFVGIGIGIGDDLKSAFAFESEFKGTPKRFNVLFQSPHSFPLVAGWYVDGPDWDTCFQKFPALELFPVPFPLSDEFIPDIFGIFIFTMSLPLYEIGGGLLCRPGAGGGDNDSDGERDCLLAGLDSIFKCKSLNCAANDVSAASAASAASASAASPSSIFEPKLIDETDEIARRRVNGSRSLSEPTIEDAPAPSPMTNCNGSVV
jgi:hypothetical protein